MVLTCLPHPTLAVVVALLLCGGLDAFSPYVIRGRVSAPLTSLHMSQPKGCASKPFEKKKIALFGAGGYLGAVTFGFLQRASSLYGTGIAGGSSPRAIGAAGSVAEQLNRVLGPAFKLAYAGEDLVRLVDISDVDYIQERLRGFDAAILGTTYQLEPRSVTPNTYEKMNPNAKTYEFYLDERYGAWGQENVPGDDDDIHKSMFRNSLGACKEAGLSHVVVVETPRTVRPVEYMNILEEEGGDITYTYIRTDSPLSKDKTYTFEKGISNKLDVRIVDKSALTSSIDTAQKSDKTSAINREDLAALIVQSLMQLDWRESRILEVSPSGINISSGFGTKEKRKQKYDQFWCPNADLLGDVLSAL